MTTETEQMIVRQTVEELMRQARITNANAESVSSDKADKLRRAALELNRLGRELEAA